MFRSKSPMSVSTNLNYTPLIWPVILSTYCKRNTTLFNKQIWNNREMLKTLVQSLVSRKKSASLAKLIVQQLSLSCRRVSFRSGFNDDFVSATCSLLKRDLTFRNKNVCNSLKQFSVRFYKTWPTRSCKLWLQSLCYFKIYKKISFRYSLQINVNLELG